MSAADFLARSALFHSLPENVRREIAQRLVRVNAPFDSTIASVGEPPDALYLVESGAIGVFVTEGHVLELTSQLGPGESFGEVEIVTGRPRAVSYGAIEDSVLYRLERDAFRALAAQHPTIVSITLRVLAERLQRLSGAPVVPWVSLSGRQLDRRLWALAPEALFFQHGVAPLELQGRLLTVAMSNPRDTAARTALARSVPNVALKIVAASEVELKRFIEAGGARRPVSEASKETRAKITFIEDEPAAHTKGSATGQQIVELVEEIVATGLSIGASDIHVESERRGVAVRYRVDGTLRPRPRLLPLEVARPLVSRFKLLARLDITETRRPADGRISVRVGKRLVDLRMSTVPAKLGEKVVLRILDAEGSLEDLKGVFMVDAQRQRFTELLFRPHGLLLVTGPTGSGKTTTLYSALSARTRPELNVYTVEDPIEYHLDGITQIQVQPDIGTTFGTILRALLRQDPDIIMIGETRDPETAKIAVEASMTGHLVLSSVHTNGTLEAIQRLADLGVEHHAIANGLLGVVHQRLVRRVCAACAEPFEYSALLLERLQKVDALPPGGRAKLLRGRGCQTCGGAGFKGRIGLFELLSINDAMREAIANDETALGLRHAAQRSNALFDMASCAKMLLSRALTTPDEVVHMVAHDDVDEASVERRAGASVPPPPGAVESADSLPTAPRVPTTVTISSLPPVTPREATPIVPPLSVPGARTAAVPSPGPASAPISQPAVSQPSLTQPISQSTPAQRSHPAPAHSRPGISQPAMSTPTFSPSPLPETGWAQPGSAQPDSVQSDLAQGARAGSGLSPLELAQPGRTQPSVAQPHSVRQPESVSQPPLSQAALSRRASLRPYLSETTGLELDISDEELEDLGSDDQR